MPSAFQFTCPSRSTTNVISWIEAKFEVSIHVPLAEHDENASEQACAEYGFNSRAPRGARLSSKGNSVVFGFVSIHVPLAEHDLCR